MRLKLRQQLSKITESLRRLQDYIMPDSVITASGSATVTANQYYAPVSITLKPNRRYLVLAHNGTNSGSSFQTMCMVTKKSGATSHFYAPMTRVTTGSGQGLVTWTYVETASEEVVLQGQMLWILYYKPCRDHHSCRNSSLQDSGGGLNFIESFLKRLGGYSHEGKIKKIANANCIKGSNQLFQPQRTNQVCRVLLASFACIQRRSLNSNIFTTEYKYKWRSYSRRLQIQMLGGIHNGRLGRTCLCARPSQRIGTSTDNYSKITKRHPSYCWYRDVYTRGLSLTSAKEVAA